MPACAAKAAVTGDLTREWREYNSPNESAKDALGRIRNEGESSSNTRRGRVPPKNCLDANLSLPAGWAWGTLEDLGSVESGQTPTGIAALTSGDAEYPWFKVSSMNRADSEGWLTESEWYVSEKDARFLRLRIHPPGTIVFPKRGGAILTNKKRRLAVAGGFDLNTMGYIPHPDYSEYLWTFFKQLDLRTLYDGSNVPQINYGDVAYVVVPVPPPHEGLEIARLVGESLSAIDEIVVILDGAARDSFTLRQSVLKAAFEGRLVEQDTRDELSDRLLRRADEQVDDAMLSRSRRRVRRAAVAVE